MKGEEQVPIKQGLECGGMRDMMVCREVAICIDLNIYRN